MVYIYQKFQGLHLVDINHETVARAATRVLFPQMMMVGGALVQLLVRHVAVSDCHV